MDRSQTSPMSLNRDEPNQPPTDRGHSPPLAASTAPIATPLPEPAPGGNHGDSEAQTLLHVQKYLTSTRTGQIPTAEVTTAWECFAGRYHPVIVGLCQRYPRAGQEPEDMAQEIWKKLLRRLPNFRYDAKYPSFQGWLFGFIRHEVLGWPPTSRDPLASPQSSDLNLRQLISRGLSPADEYDGACLKQAIHEVMLKLQESVHPTNYRLFQLRQFEGQSVSEVAATLELTPKQVRERQSRVDRKFQSLMEHHPEYKAIANSPPSQHPPLGP